MDPILALLNAAELTAADAPPEWLLLVPAGRTFRGADGRRFRSPGAAAATEAQILTAIAQTNSQSQPDAVEMVTKADYQLMANRASTAEQQLAERDAADLRKQAEAVVDEAITDAKVAPASRDFYLNRATSAEEIEQLKSFLATAPKVVTGEAAAGAQPNDAGADRRTPEEIEVDRQLGVEPEGAPA